MATLATLFEPTRLAEQPGRPPHARGMIARFPNNHEPINWNLCLDLGTWACKYGGMHTNNFLTGSMEKHEKAAWMMWAFLQDKPV